MDKVRFIYSKYWRTWSRLLYSDTVHHRYIELNLTAINPTVESEWDRNKDEIIRIHHTHIDEDKITFELPDEIFDLLISKLGSRIFHKLTTYDYLSELDQNLCNKKSNGGTPFMLCRNKR